MLFIRVYFGVSRVSGMPGRAIAQAVSRRLPTAAVRGSKPDLGMWDFVMDKSVPMVALEGA
jgi:hypothetical protein